MAATDHTDGTLTSRLSGVRSNHSSCRPASCCFNLRDRRLWATLATTITLASAARPAPAQTELELRASSTAYRFVDLSYSFGNRFVLDGLYVGEPGSNELLLGAGYELRPARGVILIPILYGVLGNDGWGVTLGGFVSLERGEWRVRAFMGHFFRTGGQADYTFVDSLDLTRAIGRWEVGASVDAYHSEGGLIWLVGPTLKWNDRLGAWALSVRFGDATEVRLSRTLAF